jgi:DNA-binding PadR family transcriptional regulator
MGRDSRSSVEVLGRYAGPATWVLSSLADGPKHGYALINDIEGFAGVRLQPGTLYAALTRLVEGGLIEPTGPDGRRQPYRLTPPGEEALREHLTMQRRIADLGLRRLSAGLVTP